MKWGLDLTVKSSPTTGRIFISVNFSINVSFGFLRKQTCKQTIGLATQ